MNILITNDDGIGAEGLEPFVRWAQKLGDVTVFAPKDEQSAKSHGIEIHKPYAIRLVERISGVECYAVESTPADCVRAGLKAFGKHFDLVLSGINRGYNLGGDILYSGTVSAAREAAYLGYTGIAVSTETQYKNAAAHMDKVWDYFCRNRLLERHCLYNVNIPPEAGDIHMTQLGGPYYLDNFDRPGPDLYQARGYLAYEPGEDLSVDTHCALHGCISVSPLTISQTAFDVFARLKDCR